MTSINEFTSDLERAQRSAVIDVLRSHRELTLDQLSALRTSLGSTVGDITLEELISGKATGTSKRTRRRRRQRATGSGARSGGSSGGTGKRRGRRRKVDTRTAAGRESFDESVLAALSQYQEPVSADEIRATTGGSSEQARASLARLTEAKRVKRTGRGRGTQYQAR